MKTNDIIPIYLDPYLLSCFDGWAIILDEPELQETFLIQNSLYQVLRVKVRFLTCDELNGLHPGRHNDPFARPFTTYRRIRILLKENVDDVEIRSLTFTPKKNGKTKNQQ